MMTALAVSTELNDWRWEAVLARDRSQDGRFVYGVLSTGIFCRPSCPSRRPRHDGVRFFDSPDEAVRGGFRACRRCRPSETHSDPWLTKVARACQLIARSGETIALETLARAVGSTRHHFLRNFSRIVGVTPREFADARRFAAVKARLRRAPDVTTAFVEAGYGSSSRFYERAVPRLAMAPTTYRAGGVEQDVRYACVATPLGRLLVASTSRGVCSVALGDSDAALVRALQAEYPRARIVRGGSGLDAAVAGVVACLEGRTPQVDLPLDIKATAFQWQVWNALRAIPRGETRTYAELARAINRPTAARAVARACATNPVAVAVPCHRVVPAAGGVGGYRWGSGRKEKLLAAEARGKRTA